MRIAVDPASADFQVWGWMSNVSRAANGRPNAVPVRPGCAELPPALPLLPHPSATRPTDVTVKPSQ